MTGTTWAGRTAVPPQPEDNDDRRHRWLPAVGIAAVLGLVGAGGYLLGSVDSDETVDADPGTAAEQSETTAILSATTIPLDETDGDDGSSIVATTGPSTTAPSTTTSAPSTVPSTTAPSSTAPDTTAPSEPGSAVITPPAPPENVIVEVPDGETRAAVLSNGTLYLGGAVPSREVADRIIQRAGAVVGEENIVDQYVIDPTVPAEEGGPLFVQDVVLFAYGSPTFDPQFTPLLDLGLMLLSQNPAVTITIVTHTDASGSDSFNQDLSVRRGESVAQYWVDRGIPAEQIRIDARGERDPVADNDTELGAQLNRRAEFYIEGLLD